MKQFQNIGEFQVVDLHPDCIALIARAVEGAATVYDYGCGYGSWIRYLSRINPSFLYRVFDPDPENHDARHDEEVSVQKGETWYKRRRFDRTVLDKFKIDPPDTCSHCESESSGNNSREIPLNIVRSGGRSENSFAQNDYRKKP